MLDPVQECICDTQQRIYEYAARMKYDMPRFSDAYLTSDFCKRAMDAPYSRFQFADEEECFDFITPEIGEMKYAEELYFDPDVAGWIGYTYRYLAFQFGLDSRTLNRKIPFSVMCRYYPGLHTIDEEAAAEIMIEDGALLST